MTSVNKNKIRKLALKFLIEKSLLPCQQWNFLKSRNKKGKSVSRLNFTSQEITS